MNVRSAVAACIYRSVLCVKESGSLINYTKIGDAGFPRHGSFTPSTSPSWTRPATHVVDRRHDEQRGSPYDAKCNVAEIGAVNMGEIGAVRKRSR